ncbi:hypothetical protein [Clostridium botulinum]|uniref:hypothetical protein n=1 Tax=Clostridium botulinum TaxID=1491 RepID=UPI00020751E5|nr:hypothetical protein [Clostridium botulinum]AEB75912.1 hypothetical protein CbC4_1232 [Clostridium botulinum BKT015925]KEH97223.1 membrane protein [Clostridium botulinum D str. 16868]KEI04667.1 membrane protein [Clostridium botulinum C/D str. Sp77]NFF28989.1 hypothetical protein [Clostridium botulinum]NFF59862.1 hypothetical protein [Clostridium botulinum]
MCSLKKVVGIISIILFLLITFQSCAAGVGNALSGTGETSGSSGMILAICMLVGGILALISKQSKGILITGIVFYLIGGLLAIFNTGSYADLKIWAVLSFIFAGLLIFHYVKNKELYNK